MQENATFRQSPFDFAKSYPVNMTNMNPLGSWDNEGRRRQLLGDLDTQKVGFFNFTKRGMFSSEMFLLGAVNDPGGNFLDPLIEAYWVPYVPIGTQGAGIAGVPYVDVPAANPPKKYIFTGSMNGCSLVATDAPVGGQIRIHHDSAHGATTFNGMNVRVRLDYAGNTHNSPFSYGDVTQGNDIATSWNFFYYNGNNWVLVSQPQVFVPGGATPGVKLNPAKAPFQTVVP